MQINRYTSTQNTSRRTGGVRYIVVHYTGSGTSRAGSALANCKYFSGGNRNASADFFVDDSGIWQYNPDLDARYTWHCGDGHGRYGITNARAIGIEVCSGGDDFTTLERGFLRELVCWLMDKYGVASEQVVRHYDASRKCCPEPYCPTGGDPSGAKWHELHAFITDGGAEAPEYSDAAPAASEPSHSGGAIAEVQSWLGCAADNIYGPDTKRHLVRKLQSELNSQFGAWLSVDGIWGPKTRAACVNVRRGARGNITRVLQGALICHGYDTNGFDGIFGGGTESAVRSYQSDHGLSVDGIAGKATFASLLG